MTITTAIAIFFLIWWVTLFAVLPWGVRSQHEGADMAPGTDPGAPISSKLGRKLLWTTLVASLIYACGYIGYAEHLVSIEGLTKPFGFTNK